MRAAPGIQNLAGLIMTVPHKIPVAAYVETFTERAKFLGACNILRRIAPGGGWHADATDGYGCVTAMTSAGVDPAGKRALLIGAGGAGSAIALSLVEAGVAELAIHDAMTDRRDSLIGRLNTHAKSKGLGMPVRIGSTDPAGFDLAINATPMGMKASDPLPMDVSRLAPAAFAADVITAPVQFALSRSGRRARLPHANRRRHVHGPSRLHRRLSVGRRAKVIRTHTNTGIACCCRA